MNKYQSHIYNQCQIYSYRNYKSTQQKENLAMKTNRSTLEVKESDKTVYPKCNMRKQHEKQSLNLICLTKTCKFYGPICALCKKQHTGHNIVPIKTFVSNTNDAHKKLYSPLQKIQQEAILPIEEKMHKKSSIQKLEESFNQIMGLLNYQVHQLSEQIRKTENRIIEEFQQTKTALQEESSKGEAIGQCLKFLNAKQYTDNGEFRRNISGILRHINFNNKCTFLFEKAQIVVQAKEEQLVREYQNSIEVYKDNLIIVQSQIKELYDSLNLRSMKEKVEKPSFEDIRPKTAQISILKPQSVTFSQQLKAPNIKIEKLGKSAKLSDMNGHKVVFLHNAFSSKIMQVTIKITNMIGIISLGVGLKEKLKFKGFKFDKTVNHGVFMISSNKFKWNYSEHNENGLTNSFAFQKNDEVMIGLKLKDKKVVFSVKNDESRKTELSLKTLYEKSFKDLQFCVCLNSLLDEVQIV